MATMDEMLTPAQQRARLESVEVEVRGRMERWAHMPAGEEPWRSLRAVGAAARAVIGELRARLETEAADELSGPAVLAGAGGEPLEADESAGEDGMLAGESADVDVDPDADLRGDDARAERCSRGCGFAKHRGRCRHQPKA